MKSALRGKTISTAEVSKVSPDGFWLCVDDREAMHVAPLTSPTILDELIDVIAPPGIS